MWFIPIVFLTEYDRIRAFSCSGGPIAVLVWRLYINLTLNYRLVPLTKRVVLLLGHFSTETNSFQICTIYGPNTSNEGGPFFDSLYPVLDPGIPRILCGDFNTVVNASTDRRGCNTFSLYAYNWSDTLPALISCYNLKDVWRLWHPSASEFM